MSAVEVTAADWCHQRAVEYSDASDSRHRFPHRIPTSPGHQGDPRKISTDDTAFPAHGGTAAKMDFLALNSQYAGRRGWRSSRSRAAQEEQSFS